MILNADFAKTWRSEMLKCADMLTKAVSVETAETLGPMLSGEVPLPAMPEPEDAIKRF